MTSNGHQWPRAAFFLGLWVPNEGEPGDTGLYWQDAHGRVYDNFNNVADSNIYYPHDGHFEGVIELHLHGQYLNLKDKIDRRTEEVRALQTAGKRRNQKIEQLKAELSRNKEYQHRAYKLGYEQGVKDTEAIRMCGNGVVPQQAAAHHYYWYGNFDLANQHLARFHEMQKELNP